MATSKKTQSLGGRSPDFRSGVYSNSRSLGNDVGDKHESGLVIVVIILMVLFLVLLPFMFMIYFDTLKVQKRVEKDLARIEKILQTEGEKK